MKTGYFLHEVTSMWVLVFLIVTVHKPCKTSAVQVRVEADADSYIQKDLTVSGAEPELVLGSTSLSNPSRILLHFNITNILQNSGNNSHWQHNLDVSGSLQDAVLYLHCLKVHHHGKSEEPDNSNHVKRNNSLVNVRVYASGLLISWDELSVTWLARDSKYKWKRPNADTNGIDSMYPFNFKDFTFKANSSLCGSVVIPLTEIVKDWISKPETNLGVLLWIENESLGEIELELASREYNDEHLTPFLLLTFFETDERTCEWYSCELTLGVAEKCLQAEQICNFHTDCVDGKDELNCAYGCDFDTVTGEGCSGWSTPDSSDGIQGFATASGRDFQERGNPAELGHFPGKDANGKEQGRYLLFLNKYHREGVKSMVIGPWYGSSGMRCYVNFSVIMYGRGVGSLELFVHTMSGIRRKMWSKYHMMGVQWNNFNVTVGAMSEPFRVMFEAVRGSDEGYFALDMVTLNDCEQDEQSDNGTVCPVTDFRCDNGVCIPRGLLCDLQLDCIGGEDEKPEICDKLPAIAHCTFEEDLCGWSNYSEDRGVMVWYRHHGATESTHTGPSADHTLQSPEGYYIYMEASDMTQMQNAMAATAQYPPPPRETYNPESPFYQMCQLRFFYHMFGFHVKSLNIHVLEILPGCDQCSNIQKIYFQKENEQCKSCHKLHRHWKTDERLQGGVDKWLRAVVPLPEIHHKYVIIFEGIRGIRYTSDIGIDDVSLSLECFGEGMFKEIAPELKIKPSSISMSTRYAFKTCGSTGRKGPTQYECDSRYKSTQVEVEVIQDGLLAGVQIWTVPKNATYSITVLGGNGGAGVSNPERSRGAYIHAMFNFTEGEKIYILVGQDGSSACSELNKMKTKTKEICNHGLDESGNPEIVGGGGGGGGGSYVFKKIGDTDDLLPLVIAGGGGGKSFSPGSNAVKSHGGLSKDQTGFSATTWKNGPGGGGGWDGISNFTQSGRALLEGAVGGLPCPEAAEYGWEISGGFGGGGGGCTAGGGGGGYTGGNVSKINSMEHNGQGGVCYAHPDGQKIRIESGVNTGPGGEVEIAFVADCPCAFMCIYENYQTKKYKCYCPPNEVIGEDGLSCTEPGLFRTASPPEEVSTGMIAGIAAACGVAVIAFALYCGYCIVSQRQKARQAVRLEQLSIPDYQLDRLRSTNTATTMMTEYNPNYDFGDSKYTIQDLKEIPRDNLNLVKALGQGAFGVVYQGYLTSAPGEGADLPVAVKTLPALCTDQAEMDFLMEAVIMSKFTHPNIVQFMGVCFEKHPRYIVLELLVGGDLKTFLREARPKPGQPSLVTMVDLVRLSLDVAKGCQHLEENHFIHRDIAARNCLLTTKGTNRVAKIADFGMARDIYRADYYRKGGKAMLPVKWMPPEAFLDGIFTSKTDVWSFGILLWEVFSMGYMPYPGRGNQEVMQLVTAGGRLEPPQNCPSPIYHIMNLCWHGIPERRPNFATVIEKLQNCLQDPEVTHSPLPVFHRPPSSERDATVVRPSDPSRMAVLSVNGSKNNDLEPDTPNSLQPLIDPQSPDYEVSEAPSNNSNNNIRHMGATASGGAPYRPQRGACDKTGGKQRYGNVFTYDLYDRGLKSAEDQTLLRGSLDKGLSMADCEGSCDNGCGGGGGGITGSFGDICSSHASHITSSDSGRSTSSQFSNQSISDSHLPANDHQTILSPPLYFDGCPVSPSDHPTNTKQQQQQPPTGDTTAADLLQNNIPPQSKHNPLTPQLVRSHNCIAGVRQVDNNPMGQNSRSLSNSPWLTRNNSSNSRGEEPAKRLYENMSMASSVPTQHTGAHKSLSELTNQSAKARSIHNNQQSNSLVNIPESRSDPGDSGVVIDLDKNKAVHV